MPVDYTGVLIALLLWIGGVWWSWRRAARITKEHPERSFRTIFWTIWTFIALTVLALFLVWFYDWIRERA